ncbi:hypothetical protein [Herbiconiux liukaitaii]|uniref:hypothetical protein n=1 Tax=Herbiconiux liukaitaii TaxID=3342799 RepID=UPI0035B7AB35
MVFPIDLTQWRVYSAEQSLPIGQEFADINEASTYLWWVQSTQWWKATFPDAPTVDVVCGGESNRTEQASFARAAGEGRWQISLHPRMMNSIVLLHEVAHCLAPRQYGDIKRIERGKIDGGRYHPHGEHFRGTFAALAERYKIGVDPQELRRAYEHFELDTASIEAVVEARAHSADVERAQAEIWARHEREWKNDPRRIEMEERAAKAQREHEAELDQEGASQPARPERGWIPPTFWGDWIWLTRRHFRPHISQKRLAAEVSSVVRCTARDVARIERLEHRPEAELDIQRAVAFAAVLDIDPVWAESHRGIAPGLLTLSLEQLEPVAPEWVEQIRHLNALLETRPPRWRVEGDR